MDVFLHLFKVEVMKISIPSHGQCDTPTVRKSCTRRPSRTDAEIDAVTRNLREVDPSGDRTARVIRNTFDQLYDGERTGRYRWDQLFRTETNGCGPLIEVNLQREFEFSDGVLFDYLIAGVEVDCKYSQVIGGWMIPPEAQGHVCLLLWAADTATPRWNMGLVRARADYLNLGANRDAKSTLNAAGRNAITWVQQNAALPINVLLTLSNVEIERIFSQISGQQRLSELFRCTLGRVIGRAAIATVARQDDYMKRVRANGGAPTHLQPEGIIILGQFTSHMRVAQNLGVPVPGRGDSVAVQLVPAKKRGPGVAEIDGRLWRIAGPRDVIVAAPDLPSV
jgi:hypothetical protein